MPKPTAAAGERGNAALRNERGPEDSVRGQVAWVIREWPFIDPDVEGIVSRIAKINRYLVRSTSTTLAGLNLARTEKSLLLALVPGPRSHGQLARELLVSTGTMTNQLDKLQRAGLVRRLADPSDRRGVLVELTGAGRERLDRYMEVQGELERELLGSLDERQKRELNELLRVVLARLQGALDSTGRPRAALDR